MYLIALTAGLAALLLTACGAESVSSAESQNDSAGAGEVDSAAAEEVQLPGGEDDQLSSDYNDALSIEGQLALGTVLLENTDLAVGGDQALELLPLWQAYLSLSISDTTASAELEAVLNQIQNTMTARQITIIAEMSLSSENLTELIEEGSLAIGRGRFGSSGGAEDATSGGFVGGGLPGQRPGGGPGGGGLPSGGPGSGGLGSFSEDDFATREARVAEGDLQERILTGAVIRLLQEKTGEIPEPEGLFAIVFEVIADETGMTVEQLQEQTAGGASFAEIIESNGADMDTILTKLSEALSDSDQFSGQDMEAFLNNILAGGSEEK
jgi:hypothetical protein